MQETLTRSDEVLVAAAKAGDTAALGSLVERYQDLVCAIAYARLGDFDNAEDIAQDAFVASFEKLQLLRSPSKYRAWLAQITRRLCTDWRRAEGYRNALADRLQPLRQLENTDTPEEILTAKEQRAIIARAVSRLPVAAREALVLYYFRGCSAAETAHALGVSESAVLKRLQRARRKIRDYLAREVETGLKRSRPASSFPKQVLAAIPAGSICGSLGLNVTKAGLMETLRHLAQAGARKATITGGGTVMTSKQAVIGGAAAVLFAASVATNVALLRRQVPPQQPPAPAVTAEDLAAATAKAEKALAEKGELSQKMIDLEKEVERQKKSADAAWKSRQALADELAAIQRKLDEEIESLGKPQRADQRGVAEQLRGTVPLVSLDPMHQRIFQLSRSLTDYREEKGIFPASLMELVGPYLDDGSAIMDPTTGDLYEYESGVTPRGSHYYSIESAEGYKYSVNVAPDGSTTAVMVGSLKEEPGSSPSPDITPPTVRGARSR